MLCTVSDIEARTGDTFTGAELGRVNAFIEDVSAAIETYLRSKGKTLPDPVPGSIKAAATMEVRRMLNVDPGIANGRVDILAESYTDGGRSYVLSPACREELSIWVKSTRKSLRTVRLVRPEDWDEVTATP